jgi:hypothetical protein
MPEIKCIRLTDPHKTNTSNFSAMVKEELHR